MSKSPGHQQDPSHQVDEKPVAERMKVVIGGEAIASSDDVIAVHETGCPVRFYFPRGAIKSAALMTSTLTTECPFKGTARYFNLVHGDRTFADAIWSYEDPHEEHLGLKGRLAFYDDKYPEIQVIPER